MAANAKEQVKFPEDEEHWSELKVVLEQLSRQDISEDDLWELLTEVSNILTFVRKPKAVKAENISQTPFGGLRTFYDKKLSVEEKATFRTSSFPCIVQLALEAGRLRPEGGLFYSKQQEPLNLQLSRRFVASIVATGFLCLFDSVDNDNLPSANFDMFFSSCQMKSQSAKIQMILNYFDRISSCVDGPPGKISYFRVILDKSSLLNEDKLKTCDLLLIPFFVDEANKIEDAGPKVLQTDFANEYLGGGVLYDGNVQEEIRFSVCPELLSSMLFMECMAPNEAVVLSGFEQFSNYIGYGGQLDYGGNYVEDPPKDAVGNILTSMVAIDAVPYAYGHGSDAQYEKICYMRDINKAYVGFLQPELERNPEEQSLQIDNPSWMLNLDTNYKRVVATGNWGCGVFGGNPKFKSMLQWISATYARCPALVYYTFHNKDLVGLEEVIQKLMDDKWTVKKLFKHIEEFCANLTGENSDIPNFFESFLNPRQ